MDYQISVKRTGELVVRNEEQEISKYKQIYSEFPMKSLGWYIEPVFVKNLSVVRDFIDSIYWKSG